MNSNPDSENRMAELNGIRGSVPVAAGFATLRNVDRERSLDYLSLFVLVEHQNLAGPTGQTLRYR